MPVARSKKLAIVERRKKVADLYIQGWTQSEIAQHLGYTQGTMCADLQWIRKEWRESMVRDFDLARDRAQEAGPDRTGSVGRLGTLPAAGPIGPHQRRDEPPQNAAAHPQSVRGSAVLGTSQQMHLLPLGPVGAGRGTFGGRRRWIFIR